MKQLIDFIFEKNNNSNINKKEVINFIKKYFDKKDSFSICGENGEQQYYMSKYPAIAVDHVGNFKGNNIICKLPCELDKYNGEIGFAEHEWDDIHVIINNKFAFFINIFKDLGTDIYDKFTDYGAEWGPDLKRIKKTEYKELIKDMNFKDSTSTYSEILNI